jgi:Putative MetA-pathway of phenol degradation
MRVAVLRTLVAGATLLLGTAGVALAEDKARYWLFNPTPERQLREMATDRPDTTESPFTVDAGHIQIESNLFGYTRSRPDRDGAVTDAYELGTTNIRIGLTNSVELNAVWQPYGILRTRQVGPVSVSHDSGIGGLDLRAKFNLWGNDTYEKRGSALALLPYVTLPTDRHNGISPEFVEGGLIVPVALKLSEKFGLGLNAGVAWIRNDGSTGYHPEYLTSASLSYEWSEKLGTYYEVAARLHTEDPRGDVVVVGTGITYKLSKNLQLDAGINIGVTPAADRVNPFVGLSTRY